MKTPLFSLLILYCLFFVACNGKSSESCMENLDGDKLFIFIGEKIDIEEMGTAYMISLPYGKFKAKYRILEKICGEYNGNTIEFIAYDHYGIPAFSKTKNSLLYVHSDRNSKDTFYHVSYTYDALYKTKDGRWASPYSFMNFNEDDTANHNVKPHKVDYDEEVSFDVKGMSRQSLNFRYPSPYYSIANKKATAHYGNYVDELVQIKKEGSLKSWGFYGNRDSANKVKVQDVTLAGIKEPEQINYNETEVVNNAYKFFNALLKSDTAYQRKSSLPNVICSVCEEPPRDDYENNMETIDSFMISAFRFILFSQLEQEIKNKNYTVSAETRNVSLSSDKKSNESVIYKVSFITYSDIRNNTVKQIHDFEFVKSNGKFLFYGLSTNTTTLLWIESRIKRGSRYFKKEN